MGDIHSWDAPIPLGGRLCWRWNDANMVIPYTSIEAVRTDGDLERGWHAELPTENGATLDLSWDPEFSPEHGESTTHLWLYVKHPDDGRLIEATIERDGDANYWIEYDPSCFAGHCPGCMHGFHQWWEYVTDGPPQVLNRLRWIGSLPIKALTLVHPGSQP